MMAQAGRISALQMLGYRIRLLSALGGVAFRAAKYLMMHNVTNRYRSIPPPEIVLIFQFI